MAKVHAEIARGILHQYNNSSAPELGKHPLSKRINANDEDPDKHVQYHTELVGAFRLPNNLYIL